MNSLQRLAEIRDLPTLPEIMIRVQELVASDEGNAQQLASLIEQDPSLTARILKIANSSYYGSSNARITSVQLAVTRIGFNEVGQIAMAASLVKKFSRNSNVLDYKQFWRHSLAAGHLTRLVATNSRLAFSTNDRFALFLSGLLHDIGILAYDQFFHPEFEAIVDEALRKEVSFLAAEGDLPKKESHAALGSALLELWKLDSAVVSAVRFHHAPDKAPEYHRVIAAATSLSEYILCNSGLGSFEGQIAEGNKNILHTLGIEPEMLPGYLAEAEAEVTKSDLIYVLEAGSADQLRVV